MTMTRTEKATHQDMILGADHGDRLDIDFTSPTIIARLGRRWMTRSEYIAHRMGRKTIGHDQAEGMREARRRYRRRPVRH
jgi:hypothetical protein